MALIDDIQQATQFRTGQRVMESKTGRNRCGEVHPRLIGYPPELVPGDTPTTWAGSSAYRRGI